MACNTIREILLQTEAKFGDKDAIRYKVGKDKIESKTYSDLRHDSEHFSGALKRMEMQGKHVAIIGMTSYEWIVAYLGTVNCSSVAVPLDVALPPQEICDLINRADVSVLVYDELRADVAAMAKEACPALSKIISMQKPEHGGEILSMKQLLAESENGFDAWANPEELCTIMFTSGTTGKSKGVMLTQRNLAENATCLDMKIPSRTVILSVLPIHHAYCLSMDILKGISLGSIICINDSPMRMAKNIHLFGPDMILMVPMMIETFAKKLEDASSLPPELVKKQVFGDRLHTICSGGAYLNPAWITLFEKFGITILQGYGMTECAPVISTNLEWNRKPGSVGRLMPNCTAKVVDEEIWVQGSSVMQGYYKMPEETKEALTEDGWLRTGDLGYVDEDHFIFLTGRKKNLIITPNGENVSPEEIENALSKHRLVQEVLVREAEGVIEAEIFPDSEYAAKAGISDVKAGLKEIVDAYNKEAVGYKKVVSLKVREKEFEKTAARKIKRF